MHGKQITNASVTKDKLNLVAPVNPNDPATKQFTEDLITTSGYLQNWKLPVKVAIGTNISLTAPGATIDGIAMSAGDRFLAFGQTTASQNGSYIWNGAAVAATRTLDFDSNAEVIDESVFPIQQGTLNGKYKKLITNAPIVLGTTALVFDDFLPAGTTTNPTLANKDMVASVTSADNQIGCATAVSGTPASDSYLKVEINGEGTPVGDGVKTKHCYFSADAGATAKAIANIANGDIMYWVGSVAGYQLAATDKVDFFFNV
jgi:hypothetical protein